MKQLMNINPEKLSELLINSSNINSMFYNRDLTASMRSRLRHLTEMGIVEHVGRKKYVLARSLYSAAGKPGVHTRKVGLDRETNKQLLLMHIRNSGEEGSPLNELQQVLPALNRGQIQSLLRELKKENQIHCIGNTKAARWFYGPAPKQ